MVPRRARFIWFADLDASLPPPALRPWLDDGDGDPAAARVLLIPDRGGAWADAPAPERGQRWAAALVAARPELGSATRAVSLGADDVVALDEGEAMIAARLRRLAASAVLRRETHRRRRVAESFQPAAPGAVRRRVDRAASMRPAVLFVGAAGGDQLQAVNALGGWHVAAYAETLDHAIRHLAGGDYRAVVISGVTDPAALGALFGYIADRGGAPPIPSLVLLRPEAAAYTAAQVIAAGADDVISPNDPQDLIHQRLTRAIDDAARRAELRLNQGLEVAIDPVSGLPGYSAFHAYATDRLEQADVAGSVVLVIELDGLDQLNLRRGFVAGDRALAAAGAALSGRLRAEDLIGRIGGAAFAVWVDHVGVEAVPALAARLTDAVRRAAVGDDVEGLTARGGWAIPQIGVQTAVSLSQEARRQARRQDALRAVG